MTQDEEDRIVVCVLQEVIDVLAYPHVVYDENSDGIRTPNLSYTLINLADALAKRVERIELGRNCE